ncbi:MAG: hypothetical protein AC479_08190 [miscellaneous Crenarchaeota group-6 archaeon AD8-1]|nr:MAG: hypothetical protein AC479_08190 [miscellaneous Crenarchaeota group-6 archaeon AD8-1]
MNELYKVGIALAAIVTLVIALGAYVYLQEKPNNPNQPTPTPSPTPITPPGPSPTPTPIITDLTPPLELFAGAATWATPQGKTCLYISWKANYETYHQTDGATWEYFPVSYMDYWQTSILSALQQAELEVTIKGDIPQDLSKYNLVVIFAYYAVEPHHSQQIKEYVAQGGSVILLSGVPCYFEENIKTLHPDPFNLVFDLDSISDWFGASKFMNSVNDIAKVVYSYPFDTSILSTDVLYYGTSGSAAVGSFVSDVDLIAYWDSGNFFAFAHEYGLGKVYYQSQIDYTEP